MYRQLMAQKIRKIFGFIIYDNPGLHRWIRINTSKIIFVENENGFFNPVYISGLSKLFKFRIVWESIKLNDRRVHHPGLRVSLKKFVS